MWMSLWMLLFAALAKAEPSCPLVPLRDDCGVERTSECWSPGQPDVDCPDFGLCCFNGCANLCGIPEEEIVTQPPPTCTIDYVTQEETVEMETCVNVTEDMTCVSTTSQDCVSQCHLVEVPESVPEETECCTKSRNLVCQDLDCDPEAVDHENTVTAEEVVCKKSPRQCFNVPQQVCHDEEVEDCQPVETQECTTVKKPVEWPIEREECTTSYTEKCSTAMRKVCRAKRRKFHGKKLLHALFKRHLDKESKKQGKGCKMMPFKSCVKTPVTTCETVTSVMIEIQDVEECRTVTEDRCVTRTETRCQVVDKEECIEEHETCAEPTEKKHVIQVKNDCRVADRECQWVDDVSCQVEEKLVEKLVPRRECRDECQPKVTRECQMGGTRQECHLVPKVMKYKVPVTRC